MELLCFFFILNNLNNYSTILHVFGLILSSEEENISDSDRGLSVKLPNMIFPSSKAGPRNEGAEGIALLLMEQNSMRLSQQERQNITYVVEKFSNLCEAGRGLGEA